MANQATTLVHWQPDGGSSIMLHTITEPKVAKAAQGEKEALFGMSPTRESFGFKKGQKASYTVTFNAPVMEGNQEYNWDDGADNDVEGKLTIETADRAHVYSCIVQSCEEDTDDKQTTMWNVTLLAKYRRSA